VPDIHALLKEELQKYLARCTQLEARVEELERHLRVEKKKRAFAEKMFVFSRGLNDKLFGVIAVQERRISELGGTRHNPWSGKQP